MKHDPKLAAVAVVAAEALVAANHAHMAAAVVMATAIAIAHLAVDTVIDITVNKRHLENADNFLRSPSINLGRLPVVISHPAFLQISLFPRQRGECCS